MTTVLLVMTLMDRHRTDEAIAEFGVRFLSSLARMKSNVVSESDRACCSRRGVGMGVLGRQRRFQ